MRYRYRARCHVRCHAQHGARYVASIGDTYIGTYGTDLEAAVAYARAAAGEATGAAAARPGGDGRDQGGARAPPAGALCVQLALASRHRAASPPIHITCAA